VLDGHSDTAAGTNSWTYANNPTLASGIFIGMRLPTYYTDLSPAGLIGTLIATFADSNGVIIGTPFEPGNSADTVAVPSGATELLLGLVTGPGYMQSMSGSMLVDVTLNGAVGGGVPEAPTYWMALLGMLALAALGARRARA